MVEREGKKGLRWGEGERREYMMGAKTYDGGGGGLPVVTPLNTV